MGVLLFFINPVIFLFSHLKTESFSKKVNSLTAVFLWIGLFFFVRKGNNADVTRMLEFFDEFQYDSSLGWNSFLVMDGKDGEWLFGVLIYIFKFFSDDRQLFTAYLAVIYGYFYSSVLFTILELTKKDGNSVFSSEKLILLIMVHSPYAFQAYRFYTAAMVFMWAILGFYFLNKKRRLIVSFLFCFLHNALFIPLIVFLLSLYIVPSRKMIFIIFNFFFLSNMLFDFNVVSVSQLIPGFAGSSFNYNIYLDVQNDNTEFQNIGFGKVWLNLSNSLKIWYFWLIANFLLLKAKDSEGSNQKKFGNFLFIFLVISSLLLNTEGYRFYNIGGHMLLLMLGLHMKFDKSLNVLNKNIVIRAIELFIVLNLLRRFSDFISVYLVFINPLFFGLINEHVTIYDVYLLLFK